MRARKFRFSFLLGFLVAVCLLFQSTAAAYTLGGEELWVKSFGTGYANAPSALLVDGDFIYTMSGSTLYKLDRFTGEVVASGGPAAGVVQYGINPPTRGGGMIFVPVRGGIVQAFDEDTLEPLWNTEKLGGQGLTPVCYEDGKIYFGTWLGEEKTGYYLCCRADKSGFEELWRVEHKGGFYRTGALIRDGKITFGSDDGCPAGEQSASASLYTVNIESGKTVSQIDGIEGDIRSSIVDSEYGLVFSTKAGYIYIVSDSAVRRVKAGTACASTPAISGKHAYIGTSDKNIVVVNLETAEVERKISASGYPQGGITIRGERLYTTVNAFPGGVYSALLDSDELETVFEPSGEDFQQYCISPVSFAEDGTLYYKNDSGHIFALSLSAEVDVSSESEREAWLIQKGETTSLKRFTLKKGTNTLKISANGGKAFVWSSLLEPLTEVLYL